MLSIIFMTLFLQGSVDASEAELKRHIKGWLKDIDKSRTMKQRYSEAVEMVPYIIDYCNRYNVDPLYIAVLASQENSWLQQGIGKQGEIGPLQIMPKWFRKKFDIETLDGQIEAGIWWFSEGLKRCKTGARAYHFYRFSKCSKVPYYGAVRRERLYEKAVKKYRERETE